MLFLFVLDILTNYGIINKIIFMEKVYGIKLMGNGFDKSTTQKTTITASDSITRVTSGIVQKYRYEDSKPRFGLIKKLSINNGAIISNEPYSNDGKKFEAIIFKKEGEKIDIRNHHYIVGGEEIDFNFERYNVHIIKI